MHTSIPSLRLARNTSSPVRPDGAFVLYWMTSARRTRYHFGLQRAVEWANALGKPLVVVERLCLEYPWASARTHAFVFEGMCDQWQRFASSRALYYPYVEPSVGAGRGMFTALAGDACVVVVDAWPTYFPRRAAAQQAVGVAVEAVDSHGLHPLAAPGVAFPTAYAFRRWLQKTLPTHLAAMPEADPLCRLKTPSLSSLPSAFCERWPGAHELLRAGDRSVLSALPVESTVGPVALRGGERAAVAQWEQFVAQHLAHYAEKRNDPDAGVVSGLAPYLHMGHISPHALWASLALLEGWDLSRLSPVCNGKREGYWGMRPSVEAFLDQLVTWRELGFNLFSYCPDGDRYSSLPGWAQETLAHHAKDTRTHLYTLEELDAGATGDPLWNAAQTELRREGRIHNYLRMLWGKKILEWSPSPEEALSRLIHLNNRYALDGCDPNSYSGIFWILGRYDRPWPSRPIFGSVRTMSSVRTAQKVSVARYLETYGSSAEQIRLPL